MIGKRGLLAGWALSLMAGRAAVAVAPVLKVGTNDSGAPWSFHDPVTNTERGIAVELIEAVAARSGFGITFVRLSLPELIPAAKAGTVDIIAANLLITPERQAQVDFSDPIAAGGDGLVVPVGDMTRYVTLDDLKGLAMATQAGPFAEGLRKSGLFPDLVVLPNGTDAMRAVQAGDRAAAVVGVNGAGYELKLGPFPGLQVVRSYRPMVSSFDAFSVRKGEDGLLRQINTALAGLHADGTVKRVLAAYGQ